MSAPFLLEQSEVKPSLHAAIMNLPCKYEVAWQAAAPSSWVEGYVNGHRDTRHAAAELANEHGAIKQELLEALQGLLDHVDRETCTHEDLYRGGCIWTICRDCDRKWADDEGGFVEHQDAQEVAAARAAIRKATLGSEA